MITEKQKKLYKQIEDILDEMLSIVRNVEYHTFAEDMIGSRSHNILDLLSHVRGIDEKYQN